MTKFTGRNGLLGLHSPFFSTIVLSKNRIRLFWVSGGFVERFGSLERMEMEGIPRRLNVWTLMKTRTNFRVAVKQTTPWHSPTGKK